jgi:hypothetical protein
MIQNVKIYKEALHLSRLSSPSSQLPLIRAQLRQKSVGKLHFTGDSLSHIPPAAIEKLTETIESYLLEPIENNPGLNPVLSAVIYAARRLGPFDPKSIAALIAGSLHFMEDVSNFLLLFITPLADLYSWQQVSKTTSTALPLYIVKALTSM